MNPMDRLTPITLGELIDEEFLQPLGVSQYRLAKAIDVPAAPIVLRLLMTPRWPVLSWLKKLRGLSPGPGYGA